MLVTSLAIGSCTINQRESPVAFFDTTVPEDQVAQLAPPVAQSAITWTVVEVIDGSTLRVDGLGTVESVRLSGVEPPVAGDCFYDQAVDGLRFFTNDAEVQLVSDGNRVHLDGRIMRHIDTTDGVDIAAEMIRAGFLVAAPETADESRRSLYEALGNAAHSEARGRFAAEACAAPSP